MSEPEFKCAICKDAHFVHPRRTNGEPDYTRVVPCRCTREEEERKKKMLLLRWCELPKKTEKMTFETFKVTAKLKEAYEAALALADEKLEESFLTFTSPSDRGKTHLLIAICRRWLERGKVARYAYVPLFLDELRAGFRPGADGTFEERWDKFLKVPLLALDDLGTENPTLWVQERLDTLIDYRLMNGLQTVVTTNLLLEQLPFRIASRLSRDGKVIAITAPSFHGKTPIVRKD